MVTLTNLIPDPSFEDGSWSGGAIDSTVHRYGSKALRLDAGGVSLASIPVAKPIVGHVYYGRCEVKTNGQNNPADCRCEVFAGDGAGLNWVISTNNGNYPDWTAQSARWTVDAVNGASYIIRTFTVSGTVSVWNDGMVLMDLTAAFGSGAEPSKEWCDANIPFFSGSMDVDAPAHGMTLSVSLQPNPVSVGETLLATVTAQEVKARLYTLPASGWSGNGPYEMVVAVAPEITPDTECIVYGDHSMDLEARASELGAMIRAEVVQPGRVRFRALSIKPSKDLAIRIVSGVPSVRSVVVSRGWWTGSGPWIANVNLGSAISTASVGVISGSSDADVNRIIESSIHVSAISGSVITLRAMYVKPTSDLIVGVMCI